MIQLSGCECKDFEPYFDTYQEIQTINDFENQEWDDIMDDSRFEPTVPGIYSNDGML